MRNCVSLTVQTHVQPMGCLPDLCSATWGLPPPAHPLGCHPLLSASALGRHPLLSASALGRRPLLSASASAQDHFAGSLLSVFLVLVRVHSGPSNSQHSLLPQTLRWGHKPMTTILRPDALTPTAIEWFIPLNSFLKFSPPCLFFQKGYLPFRAGTVSLHLRPPEPSAAWHLPRLGSSSTDTPQGMYVYKIWHVQKVDETTTAHLEL